MAKIHMETENVRILARLLDQKAGDLDEGVERLKRARSRLSGAWSGGAREKRFMSQYNSLLSQLDAKAHELQVLSGRVYREVDEWERVDSGFGARIGGFPGFMQSLPQPFHLIPDGILLPGGLLIPGILLRQGVMMIPGVGLVLPGLELLDLLLDNFPWLDSEAMLGFDGNLGKWDGTNEDKIGKGKWGIGIKSGFHGSLWSDVDYTERNSGHSFSQTEIGRGEVGIKAGIDEDGLAAGVYGQIDAFKASRTEVLGSSLFGITVGGTVAAGSLSGELGVYAGEEGIGAEATVGASVVSGEVELGMNVAGKNVGISVGGSVGAEFGVKIGTDETEIAVGPFKVGLCYGAAK